MFEIKNQDLLNLVAGGITPPPGGPGEDDLPQGYGQPTGGLGSMDAAATRPPGTNSWGETSEQAAAREATSKPESTLINDMASCTKNDTDCYNNAYEKYMIAKGLK